jgi:hypothetical protein
MNIPLFEWMAVATYVNFIYPEDLPRIESWFQTRWKALAGKLAHARHKAGEENEIVAAAAVNLRDGHI